MAAKINWKALKLTAADNEIHQLGDIKYRHKAADKLHGESILVETPDLTIFACYKQPRLKSGWCKPFETIGRI